MTIGRTPTTCSQNHTAKKATTKTDAKQQQKQQNQTAAASSKNPWGQGGMSAPKVLQRELDYLAGKCDHHNKRLRLHAASKRKLAAGGKLGVPLTALEEQLVYPARGKGHKTKKEKKKQMTPRAVQQEPKVEAVPTAALERIHEDEGEVEKDMDEMPQAVDAPSPRVVEDEASLETESIEGDDIVAAADVDFSATALSAPTPHDGDLSSFINTDSAPEDCEEEEEVSAARGCFNTKTWVLGGLTISCENLIQRSY